MLGGLCYCKGRDCPRRKSFAAEKEQPMPAGVGRSMEKKRALSKGKG